MLLLCGTGSGTVEWRVCSDSLGLPPHVEGTALTHGHDARARQREYKHAHVAVEVFHLDQGQG